MLTTLVTVVEDANAILILMVIKIMILKTRLNIMTAHAQSLVMMASQISFSSAIPNFWLSISDQNITSKAKIWVPRFDLTSCNSGWTLSNNQALFLAL